MIECEMVDGVTYDPIGKAMFAAVPSVGDYVSVHRGILESLKVTRVSWKLSKGLQANPDSYTPVLEVQ